MGKKKEIFRILLTTAMALVLAASFSLVGCGKGKEAPSGEKITLIGYDSVGLTGPYAASQVLSAAGGKDCVEYWNSQNKIPGVEFKLRTKDMGTDVAKALAAFKLAISESPRPVCFADWSTGTSMALADLAKSEKVPEITPSWGLSLWVPPKWIFGVYPSGPMVVGSEVDWFMEQWQEERPPRFAFVTWDLPCGRDWITDEEIAYVKSKGMEYVGEEFIPASPIDTTTTLLRLKDKGVDVCSGFMYASAISVVLKDAERIDFHPMWFFGPGTDLIELASYVGPLANNVCACCSTYPMRYWEDKYPAMVETLKNKGRGEEYYQDSYAWGWTTWTIAMEGVRRAVEQVGAESVTGEDVYNAMFTIKEFDPIVGIPVTYTEEMHCGSRYVPLFIARNGELEVIGPCSFPDIIPGGKDVPTEYMP